MKYRRFGKLNWKASILGFGAMRLPTIDDNHARIDENEALAMIRFAIDNGVNYIDTAYPYHGGNSETFLGKALQDGYRNKVKVATKMPTWLIKSKQDMNKYLNEQLERLNTEYIDFYLFHGLNKERWKNICRLNVLQWAEKKRMMANSNTQDSASTMNIAFSKRLWMLMMGGRFVKFFTTTWTQTTKQVQKGSSMQPPKG